MKMPDNFPMGPSIQAGIEEFRRLIAEHPGPFFFTGYSQYEGDIREWIKNKQGEEGP